MKTCIHSPPMQFIGFSEEAINVPGVNGVSNANDMVFSSDFSGG